MPKRLLFQTHPSLDELATRYHQAQDDVERSHWQNIWLLAQGKTTQEVAEVTGSSLTRRAALSPSGGICLMSEEQHEDF